MRVYIHTDIEGVAGWVFYANPASQSVANLEHTRRMNQLLTDEVTAACHAALDVGADDILINDAHGVGYNILFEQLPSKCQIIHGRQGFSDCWLSGMDASIDAMICIGQHAMAGTPHSVCPHTLWHVDDNDKQWQLSETTMAAAMSGQHGVPLVCVTGDDKICSEVADKIPEVEQVVVKWGIGAQNARSLVPRDARDLIYAGVKRALERRLEIKPFALNGPFAINLSNRDPLVKLLSEDVKGEGLSETAHAVLNLLGSSFGEDPIDDKRFRYPE